MSGFVYAIGDDERVKIGWSAQPMKRLVKIRSDCAVKVSLFGIIPATREQEREIQSLFRPWRRDGEWFANVGPVRRFIELIPAPIREISSRKFKTTGNIIREARLRLKLTQGELGNLIGVQTAAVCHLEIGRMLPSAEVLRRLSVALKIPADELLNGILPNNGAAA